MSRRVPELCAPVIFAACLLTLSTAAPSPAQERTLAVRLRPWISGHQGEVAVAVKHLPSGAAFTDNADRPMPTASLIKVAVMVEAYRQADAGTLDLDRSIVLQADDQVRGSGILTRHFSPGMQISVRDAIRLMMVYSDNTATNLVVDQIGLPATASAMEELGLPNTRLHAKVFRSNTSIFPERSREFGLGSTTAAEMLELLERLYRGELASEDSTRAMLDHMFACEDARLSRLLPPRTKVAQKGGSVNAVRTSAGIIESPAGPLAVVVLTAANRDQRWSEENAAEVLCGRIALAAWDQFNPSGSPPLREDEELAPGAGGWLVEALQRTLNERLSPSPELTVDGEFGPATEAAVRAFQESHELGGSGRVDRTTWEALGPLLTQESAIVDPETFDLNLPEKQGADPLEGPPFVTCRAFGIGNANTGELLRGENVDQPLAMASTTKLMTAWIALRTAREEPELFDEQARVSSRAAGTGGSTARLRAGERLSVRDLLYGLLLPSGNDASVVVGEHLGRRFAAPEEDPENEDPLVRFIAEMNRTAAGLGLDGTSYKNTHGLSAAGHRTSVRDLLRLAALMVEDGAVLPFVQARKHVGRLEGEAGYVRHELWTNTNRLLNTEGYLGMKTGTTSTAGACLVSLGERGAERLLVVVLGSTSTEARYTDTRNLFRWAWRQSPSSP